MTTIFNRVKRSEDKAFINPGDFIKSIPDFPEACVSTFSENIIRTFVEKNQAKQIAKLHTANGTLPIFEVHYAGKRVAVYLSLVGAPACVSCLEEIVALGAKKIVLFGCCGILDKRALDYSIIIPTSAIRDEGTSYHYIPASEEIEADEQTTAVLKSCLKDWEISYLSGKIWTTDAIYRETEELIEERKKQGCLAVEMECSAAMAWARFRGIPFAQFLYGADNLDAKGWEIRDLMDYGLSDSEKYMMLALECVTRL